MGLFFFNRSSKKSNYDFGTIGLDMHSHLIPGVDDGAKDPDDSVQLIAELKELGFNHLITTPHTLQDIHPNNMQTLKNGHSLLEGKIPGEIALHLSSEYYLDDQFQDQLDKNEVMPMPGNRLLIEFSQISRPHNLENFIFDIGIKGFQIVLAHPERYLFFHKQFNYYTRLKEMGVEFQINAMSLTDHYGKGIKIIAEKLIEKDMIDFIGTDIHHLKHIEVLRKVPTSKHFSKLIDSGLLKNKDLIQ
jgi:protein-tyrosine phosphatase